jgi:hypothetical protein
MNELTTHGTELGFSLTPRTLAEAMEFSKIIASSDMVPKDYINKPGNVLVAVQTGAELGLKPMQSLQGISVINGRPGVWGDAMRALILSHPEFEDLHEDKQETQCTVTLKRRGRSAVVTKYTMEDAKKAGLAGKQGPWQTAPKRMLQMRAFAFAARDLFADALKGIKSVEELRDYPPEPERDMGSAVVVEQTDPALASLIQAASAAAVAGMASYQIFWKETSKENRKLLAAHHETFKEAADQADREAAGNQVDTREPAAEAKSDASNNDFIAGLDAVEQ